MTDRITSWCLRVQGFAAVALLVAAVASCAASPQKIDTDVEHWQRFAFNEGDATITFRLPRDEHPSPLDHFPEKAYDRLNRRRLVGAGWDYNSSQYWSEYQLGVVLIHLQDALPADQMNPESVHAALRKADGRQVLTDGTDPSRLVRTEIAGRAWFQNDVSQYGDTFITRVDDHTMLWVLATYLDVIQAHPEWLASRKAITRQVVETVRISARTE